MKENKDILDFIKVNEGSTPGKNYFDDLAQKILENKTPIVLIPFYKKPAFWSIVAAASVTLIIVTSPFSSPKKTLVAELSVEEITQYIEENIEDFNTETIEEFIILNQTTEASSKSNHLQNKLIQLNEEEILDYIETENIWTEFDDESFN